MGAHYGIRLTSCYVIHVFVPADPRTRVVGLMLFSPWGVGTALFPVWSVSDTPCGLRWRTRNGKLTTKDTPPFAFFFGPLDMGELGNPGPRVAQGIKQVSVASACLSKNGRDLDTVLAMHKYHFLARQQLR